jgi:glyoxylase-like metal-dependent hydrolase (beta-lactamase superfamily II)
MTDENNEWFNLKEINDGIWNISDKTGVNSYLIEGKRESLLIDTGWGLGNLAELVQSLTPLPIKVVLTHGHPDHVNGAYQFPDLYITPEDMKLLNTFYIKDTRQGIIENFKAITPPNFSKNDWINAKITKTSPIKDGNVFDLGERKIKVIKCPGHTPGSICLLDKKDEILFSGDSILARPVLMNLETSLPLSTYLKSIKHVNNYSANFSTILSGHDEKPVNTIVIEELIKGVSNILEGRIEGKLEKTRFGEALVCKFNNTAIIYNENNL